MNTSAYLLTLPLAQIKAIRKAVNVLVRAGFYREDATELVITKHQSQRGDRFNTPRITQAR